MSVILIFINLILAILALWGAVDAYNSSASFHEIIGINIHAEATLYLISVVVAGISTQFKGVNVIASICAFIITISGAYVVYDSWDDTIGKTYNCFGNAASDADKQKKCVDQALQAR